MGSIYIQYKAILRSIQPALAWAKTRTMTNAAREAPKIMRQLCTGRIPQNPILCRARIDPVTVFNLSGEERDFFKFSGNFLYECPPNVPVFTSEAALKSMAGTGRKRGQHSGGDGIIPVVANLPPGDKELNDLIFVGISYTAGSASKPVISVATGGLISIPHDETDYPQLLLGKFLGFKKSKDWYGQVGMSIAVPNIDQGNSTDLVGKPLPDEFITVCRPSVIHASKTDCCISLGVPVFPDPVFENPSNLPPPEGSTLTDVD